MASKPPSPKKGARRKAAAPAAAPEGWTRKPPPEKRPRGRPSVRSPQLAARICLEIAEGKSLRSVCAAEDMPDRQTVLRWLDEDAEFRGQYARAREEQADTLADEIVEIADRGELKPEDRRVRIDARKWYAGKLKPKKYGEKIEAEHSLKPDDPIAMMMQRIFANPTARLAPK